MSPTEAPVSEVAVGDTGKERLAVGETGKELLGVGEQLSMQEALLQGKRLTDDGFRAFKQGSLEQAIESFSTGLDLMVPHVGQLAEALGPIYLAYGRALMQQAVENVDAMLVNQSAVPAEAKDALAARQEAEDQATTSAAIREQHKLVDLPDVFAPEEPSGDEEDSEGEGAPQEEDDFQLAWEVLDVARLIYSKQATPQARQLTADIHMDLGDLQMENEQFKLAIEDYRKAAVLIEGLIAAEAGSVGLKRALASTHFKLAMAHEYDNDAPAALPPLSSALALLQACLAAGPDADLEDLVRELALKAADLKTSIEKAEVLRQKIVVPDDGEAGFSKPTEGAAVNDLSGLVRKRRAVDSTPGPAGEEPSAKAPKTTE